MNEEGLTHWGAVGPPPPKGMGFEGQHNLWIVDIVAETRIALFINPLNPELNPIRHLLALVGVRHIVHFSRIRVNTNKKHYNLAVLFEAEQFST